MTDKVINYYKGAKCPKCGRFMRRITTSRGRRGWICLNLACEDGRQNVQADWQRKHGR